MTVFRYCYGARTSGRGPCLGPLPRAGGDTARGRARRQARVRLERRRAATTSSRDDAAAARPATSDRRAPGETL